MARLPRSLSVAAIMAVGGGWLGFADAPVRAAGPVAAVGAARPASGGASGGITASPEFVAALSLYRGRHYAEAQASFRKILPRAPDDPEVNFYLGRLALWFDDHARSVAYLERALQHAPGDARIENALGDACGISAQQANVFTRLAWAHRCRAAYQRAVELAPTNVDYRWSLMNYYLQAPRIAGGGFDRATAEAAEIDRLDPAAGRIALATVFVAEKKYAQAFAGLEAYLRAHPDDFEALYQIGRCAALSGERLDLGLASLRRCLHLPPPAGESKPKYVNVHFRIGNILEKQGDAAGARAEYDLALKENPDFRPAKEALRN